MTKQQSAADRLYALIDEGADESAIRQVLAERGAKPAKYYFVEGEINGSGYRFLQENKVRAGGRAVQDSTSSSTPSRGTSTTASARRC